MTNEELLEDFKQFISTTVSQSEKRLRADMATKDDLAALGGRIDDIDEKLNEILDAVGERVAHVEDTVDDHENRLQRLEHRAA